MVLTPSHWDTNVLSYPRSYWYFSGAALLTSLLFNFLWWSKKGVSAGPVKGTTPGKTFYPILSKVSFAEKIKFLLIYSSYFSSTSLATYLFDIYADLFFSYARPCFKLSYHFCQESLWMETTTKLKKWLEKAFDACANERRN